MTNEGINRIETEVWYQVMQGDNSIVLYILKHQFIQLKYAECVRMHVQS